MLIQAVSLSPFVFSYIFALCGTVGGEGKCNVLPYYSQCMYFFNVEIKFQKVAKYTFVCKDTVLLATNLPNGNPCFKKSFL